MSIWEEYEVVIHVFVLVNMLLQTERGENKGGGGGGGREKQQQQNPNKLLKK